MAQLEEYTKDTSLLDNLLRDTSLVNADDSIDSLAFDQMVEELPSGLLGSGVFAVSGTNEGIAVGVDKPNAVGYIQSRNFVTGTTGWRIDSNGDVEFDSGTFRGTITATTGAIGGFDIGADYIRDVANSMGLASTVTVGDDVRFWAGDTFANRATADFRVTESGVLTATSGTFGAWTISGNTFTTTASNMLVGSGAGAAITTGTDNIFLGTDTGRLVTTGTNNLIMGYQAGYSNAVQSYNVYLGYQAGYNATSNANTFIGYQAGLTVAAGGGHIIIGNLADDSVNTLSYTIVIGNAVTATANNQCVLGHSQGINDYYFGKGVIDTVPVALTLQNTGASGANVAGANFTLAAGKSTGSAAGGSLIFATSPAGGGGSALNALVTALTIDPTGLFTFAGAGAMNFASKSMTNVNIDSGTINGITDLAVADGGTGVSTFGGTNTLLYTTSTDTLSSIATANNSILVTSAGGVPSLATNIPTAVTIGSAYIYRASGTDVAVADGGTGLSTISALSIWLANSANTITELTPGAGNSFRINAGGTAWEAYTPTTGNKISVVTGDITVSNDVTETNLISVSIPANTLGTANAVKGRLYISDYDQDNAAAADLTIRLKYGTTTVATAIVNNFANASTNLQGAIEFMLLATGATNTQEGSINGLFTRDNAATDTDRTRSGGGVGTAAEDSTGALNVIVSVQWGATGTQNSITMAHAIIEKIT